MSQLSDEQKLDSESSNDDPVYRCGYGGWQPGWMQRFNNPKVYAAFLCWFTLIQGFAVNGINNVNTTSVERRFDLPSSQVGMISSAYDFSAGVFVIFISYYGTHGHKPRWLSVGAFIMGCGSLIMALPHFTTGLYEYGMDQTNECTGNSTDCSAQIDSSLHNYLYVLLLGQVLHGIGGTCLYTLGTVSLDENVKVKVSPVYIGFLYGTAALGPAIGYIVGGTFLSLWVDSNVVPTPYGLAETDARWVGAWWIGFVISGFLAFTVTIALCFYPRELAGAAAARADRVSQAHQNGSENAVARNDFGTTIKDMPLSIKVLVSNPTFMLVTLAGCTEGMVTSGFATFLPKFIQNQFAQTPGFSAILAGCIAVPGAAGGHLVAGFLLRKLKLKVRGMLTLSMGACFIAMIACVCFWIKCDKPSLVGINIPYPDKSTLMSNSLLAKCNANCSCSTKNYDAICAKDSNGDMTQYFSPCYAGCTSCTEFNTSLMSSGRQCGYSASDCGCILSSNVTISKGFCEPSCPYMVAFLPLVFIVVFFTFISGTPATSVTLRCIPEKQRTFGLGIQWVFIRFLGTVPGPILFGVIIDSTCLLWQTECGETGSCWTYDNALMGRNLLILGVAVKLASMILFTLARTTYKPPINKEEKEVELNSSYM